MARMNTRSWWNLYECCINATFIVVWVSDGGHIPNGFWEDIVCVSEPWSFERGLAASMVMLSSSGRYQPKKFTLTA